MNERKHLADSPIFRGLDDVQLSTLLEIAAMEMLDSGDVVFKVGDEGTALYIVMDGEIRISIDVMGGEEALTILGPGRSFGEMAAVGDDNEVRSASAIAHTDATLLAIERDALRGVLFADADLGRAVLWNVVQDLSGFLRTATDKLVFLTASGRF